MTFYLEFIFGTNHDKTNNEILLSIFGKISISNEQTMCILA